MSKSGRCMLLALFVAGLLTTAALAHEPSQTAGQKAVAVKSDSGLKPELQEKANISPKRDPTVARDRLASQEVADLRRSLHKAVADPAVYRSCCDNPEAARRHIQKLDSSLQRLEQLWKNYEKLEASSERGTSGGEDRSLDRDRLSGIIGELEKEQEEARNSAQMASEAFTNFDQKSNQAYQMLSSIIKAMNEMRMGTVRNML